MWETKRQSTVRLYMVIICCSRIEEEVNKNNNDRPKQWNTFTLLAAKCFFVRVGYKLKKKHIRKTKKILKSQWARNNWKWKNPNTNSRRRIHSPGENVQTNFIRFVICLRFFEQKKNSKKRRRENTVCRSSPDSVYEKDDNPKW